MQAGGSECSPASGFCWIRRGSWWNHLDSWSRFWCRNWGLVYSYFFVCLYRFSRLPALVPKAKAQHRWGNTRWLQVCRNSFFLACNADAFNCKYMWHCWQCEFKKKNNKKQWGDMHYPVCNHRSNQISLFIYLFFCWFRTLVFIPFEVANAITWFALLWTDFFWLGKHWNDEWKLRRWAKVCRKTDELRARVSGSADQYLQCGRWGFIKVWAHNQLIASQ